MSERLDRIEAIVESNARAITAHAERQAEFANRFDAFIQRMDEQWLQVTLNRDVADDQAGELAHAQERADDNEIRIDALRADAIADRAAWRAGFESALAKADEDRQRSDQRFDAIQAKADEDRQRSDQRFDAIQESIQRLFLEVTSTNGAVEGLNNRVSNLEAS